MKKVLIVEDDKDYRNILAETLTQEGYSVLTAGNGEEGIKYVTEQEVDLILLDLLMPKVDGITFYNHLKNVLKKQIPILVLTNVTSTEAYGPNIKDVLIKANVSLEDVIAKVKEIA